MNFLAITVIRLLCSFRVLDDECDTLKGLKLVTDEKSTNRIDVLVAAPCSHGKMSSSV